ncbi:hypothetical protein CGI38_04490 [Vibrio parahaemolyticus]|nr:hypothetical protein CGI38_04490 [Vibrio parahaemolyticus]
MKIRGVKTEPHNQRFGLLSCCFIYDFTNQGLFSYGRLALRMPVRFAFLSTDALTHHQTTREIL